MDDDMAVDIAVHFTLDICRLDGCHMDDDMAVDIAEAASNLPRLRYLG